MTEGAPKRPKPRPMHGRGTQERPCTSGCHSRITRTGAVVLGDRRPTVLICRAGRRQRPVLEGMGRGKKGGRTRQSRTLTLRRPPTLKDHSVLSRQLIFLLRRDSQCAPPEGFKATPRASRWAQVGRRRRYGSMYTACKTKGAEVGLKRGSQRNEPAGNFTFGLRTLSYTAISFEDVAVNVDGRLLGDSDRYVHENSGEQGGRAAPRVPQILFVSGFAGSKHYPELVGWEEGPS